MRVLILGCGYVGMRLGRECVRLGHTVFALRRSAEQADPIRAAGMQPLIGDMTSSEQVDALPGPFDWIVNVVSSSRGGLADYRRVYLEGTRNLIDCFSAAPLKKFVYTSSTGVYGQTDGSQVKETSPTAPAVDTAEVLIETERLLLEAYLTRKFPALILRVAGIYGPDRGHYFKQFISNEARIPGRGERFLNMIHVDDVVGIILAALQSGRPGEIYNAVDDEPVMQVNFYRWLSETLGKWMPPFTNEPDAVESKRGVTNKKVLNRKLKMELGYQFKYPTFRQGYTAEIQRLESAGLLNIEPDPR